MVKDVWLYGFWKTAHAGCKSCDWRLVNSSVGYPLLLWCTGVCFSAFTSGWRLAALINSFNFGRILVFFMARVWVVKKPRFNCVLMVTWTLFSISKEFSVPICSFYRGRHVLWKWLMDQCTLNGFSKEGVWVFGSFGSLGLWVYGSISLWVYGSISLWVYGS